jgi:hypothetical protein
MEIKAKSMPDGVSLEDGKLSVDVKKESLVGGYTVEYIATCSEGPLTVSRTVMWPVNIISAVEEEPEAETELEATFVNYGEKLK